MVAVVRTMVEGPVLLGPLTDNAAELLVIAAPHHRTAVLDAWLDMENAINQSVNLKLMEVLSDSIYPFTMRIKSGLCGKYRTL